MLKRAWAAPLWWFSSSSILGSPRCLLLSCPRFQSSFMLPIQRFLGPLLCLILYTTPSSAILPSFSHVTLFIFCHFNVCGLIENSHMLLSVCAFKPCSLLFRLICRKKVLALQKMYTWKNEASSFSFFFCF